MKALYSIISGTIFAAAIQIHMSAMALQSAKSNSAQHVSSGGPENSKSLSDLSNSFQCPEIHSLTEAKQSAVTEFVQAYVAQYPNSTPRDIMLYRYRLLVGHSCFETLRSILAHINPTTEMLLFNNQDYGPKTEEFDPATKVWTVYYKKSREQEEVADEELILNFYGWEPATDSASIARAFIGRRDNIQILGKFQAPDDITKAPAYFIVSETVYPKQTYGYVNISKITSVGSSTYTVTFSKKISGASSADVDNKTKQWVISEEGKAVFLGVGNVGVDAAWQEYLTKPHER